MTEVSSPLVSPAHNDVRVRVVLVDDHQLIRGGLRLAFGASEDFEIVGEASRAADALMVIDRVAPDVVVTDVRLPDGDGITLTARLRAEHPGMGIVVLTMYVGDDQMLAALEAGASGFVGKDVPAEDVVAAARHAANNPSSFTARGLAGAMQRRMNTPAGPTLSPREREVLDLLVDGFAILQIGRRLYIGESTVKTHVGHIYTKLGVGNRAQLVRAAVRLGLVDSGKKNEEE
jgi:DNA-binding NarL/FixJ family response regulator